MAKQGAEEYHTLFIKHNKGGSYDFYEKDLSSEIQIEVSIISDNDAAAWGCDGVSAFA